LHYLNAVLQESFRTASLVASGVPHYTTKAIKLDSYIIPKGSIIYGSLYHIMNDPEYFKDPHSFKPERFIDGEGKFVLNDRIFPFGIGKRICLGQTLAEKEFYIFFAGMMQQFQMAAAPGKKLPSYDFDQSFPKGSLRTVPPYDVILKNRLHS
jgi:cytochrome P450